MNPGNKWPRITIVLAAAVVIAFGGCKNKDEGGAGGLLLLAALLNRSGPAPFYAGFTDIPNSITQSAANTSSSASTAALTVAGDPTLEGIANVFNPMRDVIKLNREIIYHVGTLVYFLKRFDPAGQVWQDTTSWGNQSAKIQYQDDDTVYTGGRKLEVWWDNAPAPYNSLKAMELIFKDPNPGNEKTQDIQGHLWARFLNEEKGNSLGMIFVEFSYDAANDIGSMKVIITGGGKSGTENAHMYVRRENDITSVDGTIIVKGITEAIHNTTSDRAYVFSAAGSDESGKAVVKAGFPLLTSTTVNAYDSGIIEAFAEVYTDWILYDTVAPDDPYDILKGIAVAECSGLTATTGAGAPNQDAMSGSSAIDLISCFDNSGGASFWSTVYYIPNIQNPAYFSYNNGRVVLEQVGGTTPSGYATLEGRTLTGIRQAADLDYGADFLAPTVDGLDFSTGAGMTDSYTASGWTTDGTAPF